MPANKIQLIEDFRTIIKGYDAIPKNGKLPWFLDGKPGIPGLERFEQAKKLLNRFDTEEHSVEWVLYKLCKFYMDKGNDTYFRSRLLNGFSGLERLLDCALGTARPPVISTSATKILHDYSEQQTRLLEAIQNVIDDYEEPIELKPLRHSTP